MPGPAPAVRALAVALLALTAGCAVGPLPPESTTTTTATPAGPTTTTTPTRTLPAFRSTTTTLAPTTTWPETTTPPPRPYPDPPATLTPETARRVALAYERARQFNRLRNRSGLRAFGLGGAYGGNATVRERSDRGIVVRVAVGYYYVTDDARVDLRSRALYLVNTTAVRRLDGAANGKSG